jgi:hypothetical protein
MKQPNKMMTRAATPIAAAMTFALGITAPLALTAPSAWAKICYMPNGHPYECQDWIPTNEAVPPPPGPGPFNTNWGDGIPCSTDPRFPCPGQPGPMNPGGASTGPSQSGQDAEFLRVLAEHSIGAADGDNAVVINAGKAICSNLDSGATGAQEASVIHSGGKLSLRDADIFVGAAIGAYCPNHNNRHDVLGTQ